jgi:hypothetical protein
MSGIPRSESRNGNPNPDNARIKILLLENIHENAGVCLQRKPKVEKSKKMPTFPPQSFFFVRKATPSST